MAVISPAPELRATSNLFLDTLDDASAMRLFANLERVQLPIGHPIATAGSEYRHVYFPTGGAISTIAHMQEGIDVEVSLVGREGFFGVTLVFGSPVSTYGAMVQLPDVAYRMAASDFSAALADDDSLRERAGRFAQSSYDGVAQFSACNRLHSIERRTARWLLMAHDRVIGDEVLLTQEYLATMLGVRRPSVSVAASAFERSGHIDYRRGRIFVRDRSGLESAACECYAAANDSTRRLMGYDIRKTPS